VETRMDAFKGIVASIPAERDALGRPLAINRPLGVRWRHRMLIEYGRMVGAVEVLVSLGHITRQLADVLNGRIKGATHRTLAKFLSGGYQ